MESARYEIITKLQAAERQLKIAIRLFFEGRDLVAVHTLGAAAQEVLIGLGRRRGIKSIKDSDFIRPERKKDVADIFVPGRSPTRSTFHSFALSGVRVHVLVA